MKLQEAIDRSTEAVDDNDNLYVLTNKPALLLLIEAGKLILLNRELWGALEAWELPEETAE